MSKKSCDTTKDRCAGSGSHPTHKRSMTVHANGSATCNVCGDPIRSSN